MGFSIDETIAAYVDENNEAMRKEWLEVMSIPGKSRQEQQRTAWFEAKFREVGLDGVTVDDIGNVWGSMEGNPGKETVVVTGHMDSVFANDTPLNPKIEDGWVYCPGAGDDVPAPLALTWLKRGLDSLGVTPACNVLFLATVQEEIGLRGMKHYLTNAVKTGRKPDMLIAVDGQLGDVVTGGLGIDWYKVYANTQAGHTLKSTGKPSAVKSLALAITEAYKFQAEQEPPVFLNLGVIGGGTTENAVCEEAWVTLDMRSPDVDALKTLEDNVFAAMEKAIVDSGAAFRKEQLSNIVAGQQPDAANLKVVHTALGVLKDLGYGDVPLKNTGATDGNISISMGIPTVSVGIVQSENAHSTKERSKLDSFAIGMKQLLMMLERLK
ncbi:MAG: M20/M25/M40 family metallo-hydrolase [Synergistaceae bacterium]|jgi:acetylornithine deacetylase/succinyl-diaminopimelate desuccinylase-like protein|nr:M20/M25/M40 family metallo-hydrolase [Synergistaceae bacterium]